MGVTCDRAFVRPGQVSRFSFRCSRSIQARENAMNKFKSLEEPSASKRIAKSIAAPTDWRGQALSTVRRLIREADTEVVEEVKWRKPSNGMVGVPVWSRGGIICTGETYKDKVKLTFAKGASLKDPGRLFNASLDGNTRRAIDIREHEGVDADAFKVLVRAAVTLNTARATQKQNQD